MTNKRINTAFIIVGQEQSGKSFFSYQKGLSYIKKGGVCMVYNDNGNPSNYSNFNRIEFLTKEEHKLYLKKGDYERLRHLILFRYEQKVYHAKDLIKLCKGKGFKMFRHIEEKMLFPSLHKYLGHCLFIFDDAREVFRYGISGELGSFLARKNHASEGKGMDIIIQFHSFPEINKQLFSISDGLIIFKNTGSKDIKLDDKIIFNNILKANDAIQKSEPYSKILVGLKGELYNKIKYIKND